MQSSYEVSFFNTISCNFKYEAPRKVTPGTLKHRFIVICEVYKEVNAIMGSRKTVNALVSFFNASIFSSMKLEISVLYWYTYDT